MNVATDTFLGYRELLFSVVYTMLGTVADTEDVLQEVWLAWIRRSGGSGVAPIDNPRAYLTRMAVNQALVRREALSRRREEYVGQWLPEPLVAESGDEGPETVLRAESFSMAVMVVLESLTSLERAVFVLNEVFGYRHTEIAEMLDRSPAAVRQIAYRAREHVQARRPRTRAHPRECREVTERFVVAAMGGDIEELLAVLAPDVTLWTDGGDKGPRTSLRPVRGATAVAELFANIARHGLPGVQVRRRTVGGDPGAVVFSGGSPLAVIVLDIAADRTVTGIYSVTNPDKLTRIQ
jgi:RNA polymerase sigma-70 factor (ECF subfamily)